MLKTPKQLFESLKIKGIQNGAYFQKIINKSIQIIPFIILFYLWFFLLGNFLSPSGSPNMLSHLNQNLLSLFIFVFTQIFLYIFFKIYKYKYIVMGYVLILVVYMLIF